MFRKYSFDRRWTLLLFAVLTFIAVARSLQHMFVVDVNQPVQYGLWWHVPFNMFMWWNWFLFVPLMQWLTIRLSRDGARLRLSLTAYFLLPVGIIILRQAAAAFISTAILPDKTDFYSLFQWRLVENPWVWLDLIVYIAILIALQIIQYQRMGSQHTETIARLETQYIRSQLNALRSQLRPHFLFNTLNTVSTLILKEDNAEAERMLSLLTTFLTTTAVDTGHQEIPLSDELRFINGYLEIEKVRFIDKLEIRQDIAPQTCDALVPGFLLQPIVENAIYHAIALKPAPGVIIISSSMHDGRLTVSVEDDGPGRAIVKRRSAKEGVGLKITKERLAYLYGDDHSFAYEHTAVGGTKVSISLPVNIARLAAVQQ